MQIRNYVKKNIPQFITKPENHIIHDLLSSHPETRHLVSCFVSAFATSVCTKHLKAVWSTELNDEIWEEALLRIKSCSVNSRYKLIQFKVIHRLHYSKTRLNKIFPSISSQCDRCNRAEVTLAHLFGFCPVLYVFWSKIFELFSSAYKINIQPDHSLAIFWLFWCNGCSSPYSSMGSNGRHDCSQKSDTTQLEISTSPLLSEMVEWDLYIIQMEQLHFGDSPYRKDLKPHGDLSWDSWNLISVFCKPPLLWFFKYTFMKYWIYKTIVNIVIYVYILIFSITMLYIFVNWGSPFIFLFFCLCRCNYVYFVILCWLQFFAFVFVNITSKL